MKTTLSLFTLLIVLTLSNSSCWLSEMGPNIDTTSHGGTNFQLHRVLLEDITGVRCTNCPSGHELASTIASNNGGRVEIVSIHSGSFAVPFSFSYYDFNADCPEGTTIDNWLGPSSSWPCAAIDRKIFSGETALFLSTTKWAGYVAQELSSDTPVVSIDINKNYNGSSRTLNVSLNLHYNNTESVANYFTIYLVEDSLIDPQSNDTPSPVHIDTFYTHMNVLRHVLTAYNGQVISGATTSGNDITTANYSYVLPANINPLHCRVVAFVSEFGTNKNVLQVMSKPLY